MKTEIPTFNTGTYDTSCSSFPDITIGSVQCVGHSKIDAIKPCQHCVSYKEENTYYLPVLKEHTPIVSEVICNRPLEKTIFNLLD